MDRVDLVLAGQGNDAVDIEVRAERLARGADAIRLIGLEAMQREAILVRVNGDGANAQSCAERNTRMAISLRLAASSRRMGRPLAGPGEAVSSGMVGGSWSSCANDNVPVKARYYRKCCKWGRHSD